MGAPLCLLAKCHSDLCQEREGAGHCCNGRCLRRELERTLVLVLVELKEEENLCYERKMLALSLCSLPKPHRHHHPGRPETVLTRCLSLETQTSLIPLGHEASPQRQPAASRSTDPKTSN